MNKLSFLFLFLLVALSSCSTASADGRVQLSDSLFFELLFFTVMFLIMLIGLLASKESLKVRLIGTLIFFVFGGLLLSILFNLKDLEFNSKSLFIIDDDKEQKIPLAQIQKIKLTMTSINSYHLWKIHYLDSLGTRESVRFMPLNDADFASFKDRVKELNPNVVIQNWSHSLDFDQ